MKDFGIRNISLTFVPPVKEHIETIGLNREVLCLLDDEGHYAVMHLEMENPGTNLESGPNWHYNKEFVNRKGNKIKSEIIYLFNDIKAWAFLPKDLK